jgi:chorismate mutase/prephenate dehydratase
MSNQVEELREQIDNLDTSIVNLLNERAMLALDIDNVKKEIADNEMKVNEPHDPAREMEVYEQSLKIQQINKGPLPNSTLVSIFREIMSASLSLNKELKIGYLGPRGTYSHQATVNRFGDSVIYSMQKTIAGMNNKE